MTSLLNQFIDVRNYTESIFKPLLPLKIMWYNPSPIVSPPKWSLGHTTWFFETFILQPI